MSKLMGLGLIALMSMSAHADIYGQIKACGAKSDEVEMLHCFKGLPIAKIGEWNVYAPKESLTAIGVQSTVEVEYSSGEKKRPFLSLSCVDGKLSALITLKDTFADNKNQSIPVQQEIDGLKADAEEWQTTNEMRSIASTNPVKFVKNLMDKKELKLQATAMGDHLIEFNFPIAELKTAANELDKQCLSD